MPTGPHSSKMLFHILKFARDHSNLLSNILQCSLRAFCGGMSSEKRTFLVFVVSFFSTNRFDKILYTATDCFADSQPLMLTTSRIGFFSGHYYCFSGLNVGPID